MRIKLKTTGFRRTTSKLKEFSKKGASNIMSNQVRKEMALVIEKEFFSVKEQYLEEFMNHPVTQAVLGDDTARLIDYGNLRTFLGLTEDQAKRDIRLVKELIEQSKVFISPVVNLRIVANFYVPDNKEIFDLTPLPWSTGRSWMKAIESGGVAGFGKYLFEEGAFSGSRTGDAIQTKNKIRSGKMKPTKYISDILNRMMKDLRNLI